MKITFTVTAEDVARSRALGIYSAQERLNGAPPLDAAEGMISRACPVAIALARVTGERVVVGITRCSVGELQMTMPQELREWVSAYDTGPVAPEVPATFEIKEWRDG